MQGYSFDSGSVTEAAQTGPLVVGPGASRSDRKDYLLPKLSRSQKDALHRAKKYAMEQSIKTVLLKQTIAHQQQQMINVQQSIQKQQAFALMCRVYVGTINFEIREDTVKQAFLPFGPIKSISLPYDSVLKKHKGFAFIEYDIPEAASIALEQMNGVMICGFSIKVGRPSNMPQAQPIIQQIMEEAKSYKRIYVASIHPDLGESDVRSVFEAFGRILSCKLAPEPMRPGKHRGYGFIEYDSTDAVNDAVTAMNLFDLGGMYLRVGRCVTPPDATHMTPIVPGALPTASAIAAAAVTAKLNALDAFTQPPVPQLPVAVNPLISGFSSTPGAVPSFGMPQIITPTINIPGMPPTIPPPGVVSALPSATTSIPGLTLPNFSQPPPNIAGFAPGLPVISTGAQFPFTSAPPPMVIPSMTAPPPPPPFLSSMTPLVNNQSSTMSLNPTATNVPRQESVAVGGAIDHQKQLTESRVMVLKNMVDADEVDEELENEVSEECGKYGSVLHVTIYHERQVTDDWAASVDANIIVKIFVEFVSQSDMESAVAALNGRFFAGRSIIASRYDQQLYDNSDFSG